MNKKLFIPITILLILIAFPAFSFAQDTPTGGGGGGGGGGSIGVPIEIDPFCGSSTYGRCETDSDCLTSGCSGQTCGSVYDVTEGDTGDVISGGSCQWWPCYDDEAYGVSCGCVQGSCQWDEIAGGGPVCGNGACEGDWEEQNCPSDCPTVECKDYDAESSRPYYTKSYATVTMGSGGTMTVSDGCLAPMAELASEYELYQAALERMIDAGVITESQVSNPNTLLEAFCPSPIPENYDAFSFQTSYNCPNGCSEGACIAEASCVCEEIYAPVCGTNGKTYSNRCVAGCENVEIAYEGDCKDVPCPTVYCDIDCIEGRDENGCPICECNEPKTGTAIFLAYDEYNEPITIGLFGLIYKLPYKEGIAKVEFYRGKATADLEEGNYSITVIDYSGKYHTGVSDFPVKAGSENEVRVVLRRAQTSICGNGICEVGEDYSNCSRDCEIPCICPEIYKPVCGTDGKTYSNSCFAGCEHISIAYDGKCREESFKVEIGEKFNLVEAQSAVLLEKGYSTGITVRLNRINYAYPNCIEGQPCDVTHVIPTVEVQISKTEGNMGAGMVAHLTAGETVEAFGIKLSNLGIWSNSASFLVTKEIIPGYVKVKLGEKFALSKNQQANVLNSSGNTVMKLTFEGVSKAGICSGGGGSTTTVSTSSGGGGSTTSEMIAEPTVDPAPPDSGGGSGGGGYGCYTTYYAQFHVSIANGGTYYISLRDGEIRNIGNYTISLTDLMILESYPEQYRVTLVVNQESKPETVIAYLDRPFNLYKGQDAIVRETRLRLRMLELYDGGAVLEVLQPPIISEPTPPSGGGGSSPGLVVRASGVTIVSADMPITVAETKRIIEEVDMEVEQGNIAYAPYIKIRPGEEKTVYGHIIRLNSIMGTGCDGSGLCEQIPGGLMANLTVSKKTEPTEKRVFLNQTFDLLENQRATVLSYNRIRMQEAGITREEAEEMVLPMYEVLKVKLLGIDHIACIAREGDQSYEQISCDSRPVVKALVELPADCLEGPTNSDCTTSATYLTLREGEERTVGGYVVRLIDVASGKAWFVVREAQHIPDLIKVRLDEHFKLQEKQTAFLVEENLFIKLEGTEITKCATGDTKCIGGSYAKVSVWKELYERDGAGVPVGLYTIKQGEALSLYGINIKLLDLGSSAASFVASKNLDTSVINVHINQPFKLREKQAAQVLEANMRMDLLQVTHYTCITTPCSPPKVEISISNYLFAKDSVGREVEVEDYLEKVVQAVSTALTIAIGGSTTRIMPIPPAPFEIFVLGEGESVEVNDFVIKVIDIGSEHAEFIVSKKGSDQEFTFKILNGWNLFSIPGEIEVLDESHCESRDIKVFEYIEERKEFVEANDGKTGQAYWIYNPGQTCTAKGILREPVTMIDLDPLVKGWNFVAVTVDMIGTKVRDLDSDCGFRTAFFYDAASSRWEKAMDREIGTSDLGSAFAVYTSKECFLGGATEPPMPSTPGGGGGGSETPSSDGSGGGGSGAPVESGGSAGSGGA